MELGKSCPFPDCCEDNRIQCSRCEGYGGLVITESKDDAGNDVSQEIPRTLRMMRNHLYSAMDDIYEGIMCTQKLDPTLPQYESVFEDEFAEELASGKISDPVLVYGIPKERYHVHGYRAKASGRFLIIEGEYGFYVPNGDGFVRIAYEDLGEIAETPAGLEINYAVSEDREQMQCIKIMRTQENERYLRELRLALAQINRGVRDWGYSHQYITVMHILEHYIGKMAKNGKEYLYDHSLRNRSPVRKLRQVLFTYAAKVHRAHVAALVDATKDGTNDRGIVFAQDGLAFCSGRNYGYIAYKDIRYITTNEKKTAVTLHGFFDECRRTCKKVSFYKKEYNIEELEKCFRELMLNV